jgi:excisionase family DNA binding protein
MPIERTEEGPLLSITEAGERLGLSRRTAFRAASDGSLPTIRIAGRRYVSRAVLEELLRGGRAA